MRLRTLAFAAALLPLFVPPSRSGAQQVTVIPAESGDIVGFVRDAQGAPIPNATVVVLPNQRTRADSSGRFVIENVKRGLREIRVRRIGYAAFDATIRVKADGRDTVRAELDPAPPRRLPAVVTRAERECDRFEYEGLLCRKEDGRGRVYTLDEIEELQPEYLADLLEGFQGIRVVYALDKSFGAARVPRSTEGCLVQLMNGRPNFAYWTPWAKSSLDRVAGLEVYGPDELPPEYVRLYPRFRQRCGLIVVWTWDRIET